MPAAQRPSQTYFGSCFGTLKSPLSWMSAPIQADMADWCAAPAIAVQLAPLNHLSLLMTYWYAPQRQMQIGKLRRGPGVGQKKPSPPSTPPATAGAADSWRWKPHMLP